MGRTPPSGRVTDRPTLLDDLRDLAGHQCNDLDKVELMSLIREWASQMPEDTRRRLFSNILDVCRA